VGFATQSGDVWLIDSSLPLKFSPRFIETDNAFPSGSEFNSVSFKKGVKSLIKPDGEIHGSSRPFERRMRSFLPSHKGRGFLTANL